MAIAIAFCGAAEADHIRPRMDFDQQLCELDIFRAVQRSSAHVDRGLHRGVDVGSA
jgi:hypothetical protein